jgi:hypothetical protein
MTTHVGHKPVERGAAVLRAADALVDVFDGPSAARLGVAAQFEEVVLGRLIVGRDAGVDGNLHTSLRRRARLLAADCFFRVRFFRSSHARSARST